MKNLFTRFIRTVFLPKKTMQLVKLIESGDIFYIRMLPLERRSDTDIDFELLVYGRPIHRHGNYSWVYCNNPKPIYEECPPNVPDVVRKISVKDVLSCARWISTPNVSAHIWVSHPQDTNSYNAIIRSA